MYYHKALPKVADPVNSYNKNTLSTANADLDSNTEQMVRQYAYLVKKIGNQLAAKTSNSVQLDDLLQAGMLGLLEAYRNFDETKGAKFETYANIRIRGSMLDELRKIDWAPRATRKNAKAIARAIREVEQTSGKEATDQEIADKLEVDLDTYYKMLKETSGLVVFSFEFLTENSSMSETEEQSNNSEYYNSPPDACLQHNFNQALCQHIANLPDRERLMLGLYYKDDLNLKEISAILGVSESRVSQLHSKAILRLKARLQDWTQA